jgi:hypothetical protein
MKNNIEFKGPFNIYNLDKVLEQKLKSPGIYIWGFMVDSKYKPINCKNKVSFFPDKMKFLPYYVGMATGKSKMTIFKRLNKHKDVREFHANKYLRINEPFYKSFFKNEWFPIHYDRDDKNYNNNLIIYNLKNNNKAISYFNNPMLMFFLYKEKLLNKLNELFNVHEPNNLPITLDIFNDCIKFDILNEVVNNKLNFWFCYAEYIDESINDKDKRKFYEDLESLIYFSLKGKTIGKVKRWDGDNKGFIIKDKTNTNIFKFEPSTKFPGY